MEEMMMGFVLFLTAKVVVFAMEFSFPILFTHKQTLPLVSTNALTKYFIEQH